MSFVNGNQQWVKTIVNAGSVFSDWWLKNILTIKHVQYLKIVKNPQSRDITGYTVITSHVGWFDVICVCNLVEYVVSTIPNSMMQIKWFMNSGKMKHIPRFKPSAFTVTNSRVNNNTTQPKQSINIHVVQWFLWYGQQTLAKHPGYKANISQQQQGGMVTVQWSNGDAHGVLL